MPRSRELTHLLPHLIFSRVGFFKAPLTSVNLLRNDIGETAADIVRAAEQHGKIQTLCGIKPGQENVDFSDRDLKAADAALLAYDIKVNAPLKTLILWNNQIGDEGAKAIAAVLPRCVQLRNEMRSELSPTIVNFKCCCNSMMI